jgi:DNA-binding NarL/FixJ family response regulator
MTVDGAPGREPITVVVAGGGLLGRAGIERVIGRSTSLELVGTCADLDTARALLERTRPRVLVTDVRLAPAYATEGIALALEVTETLPQTGVVALSDAADPRLAAAFFTAGGTGRVFLVKGGLVTDRDLTRGIEVAARGGVLMDAAVLRRIGVGDAGRNGKEGGAPLTARERNALADIAARSGARANRMTRW